MAFLELKIPPVAVVLLFALAMWGAAACAPSITFSLAWSSGIAVAFVLAGSIVCLAGVLEFRRAQTTVNPLYPNATSSLVTSGIYRLSRNPMYLGFLLVLTGCAAYLSHGLAAVLLFGFAAYMNHFQIAPEEQMLATKFGAEFTVYKQSVRRWL